MEWWQSLITGLVIAGATSWVTVQLALRRFYRERWWERRMEAYTKVIEALHHMKRDLSANFRALMEHRELGKEFEQKFAQRHAVAFDDITRSADIGDMLFSPKAVEVLTQLLKALDEAGQAQDYFEYLDTSLAAVQACLAEFRPMARHDLGLPDTQNFRPKTWE